MYDVDTVWVGVLSALVVSRFQNSIGAGLINNNFWSVIASYARDDLKHLRRLF
jgi:hypothetical protein